jgi:GntR family transcriptional regulator, transcriptional repressor for pyruvate dehydrogenase complex
MVATILFDYRSKTVKRATDLKESAEQHHNIYRAMREHNPEAARQAMRDHLVETQRAQRLEVEREKREKEKPQNGRSK